MAAWADCVGSLTNHAAACGGLAVNVQRIATVAGPRVWVGVHGREFAFLCRSTAEIRSVLAAFNAYGRTASR